MPLVPVSLFARLILLAAPAWFARRHDPSQKAHQLFFAVIALHAMQSLLLTLRWGHGIEPAGRFAGFTAPVLPVIAYMSCRALSAPLRGGRLWPLAVILVNWMAAATVPEAGGAFILVTYPGFGGLPIGLARRGPDRLALLPRQHLRFHQHEGRNVGLIVGVLQSALVLIIGLCAAFGPDQGDTGCPPSAPVGCWPGGRVQLW